MKLRIIENQNTNTFIYQWKNDKEWNTIEIEAKKDLSKIEIDSEAEFITEHYFGYTKIDEETTFEYEVTHPRWEQFEVVNHRIDIDFEKNYGSDFGFLQTQKPTSIFLAQGSKITVKNKRKLQILPVLKEMY